MNQNDFTLIGMVAMLMIVMTREVLNFIDKKKNGIKGNNPIDFHTLYSRVGEIHKNLDDGNVFQCVKPALERMEKSLGGIERILDRIEDKLGRRK